MQGSVRTADTIAGEHRRRRVFRVATAYALVTWVLLQLGEITFEPLQLPAWSLTALIWTTVLGFPVAMALAWLFELSPTGFRRVRSASLGSTLAALAVVILLDVAAGYYLYRIYAPGLLEPAPQSLAELGVENRPPPGQSIAVLPFLDLSPEGDQKYFSDGISEELLNVLAKVEGLSVAARSSSFAFRSDDRDVREIGRLLNVATVLEGSIRKSGDSVRVTAQLIDTRDGFHLWSNNYDRRLEDILAIQDEIAGEIVKELLGSYDGFAGLRETEPPIASFAAYDLYLQGREFWRQRTPASLVRAAELFQQTIDLDPAYAPAYSGLADTYLLQTNYGNLSVPEAVREASPLIHTALELDGQLSEGFASLGLMYWMIGKFSQGEAHLRRAVKLDPENTTAIMWLGSLIGGQGRLGEERLVLQQALEKDPLNLLVNINMANNQLRRGEVEAGMTRLDKLLEIFPTSTVLLRTLGDWSAATGDYAAAFGYVRRAMNVAPEEPPNLALMTRYLLDLGATERAYRQLEEAMKIGPENLAVADVQIRYLMVSGRIDELYDLAEARLENAGTGIASAERLRPHFWLGIADMLSGRLESASGHFDVIIDESDILDPSFTVDTLTLKAANEQRLAHPEAVQRLTHEAQRIVEHMRLQGLTGSDVSYFEACIAALQANTDQALDKLREAQQLGWMDLWLADHDPRIAAVRQEARFENIRDAMAQTAAEVLAAEAATAQSIAAR